MSDYLDPHAARREAANRQAARLAANAVTSFAGGVLLSAAAYHFGGWWGVVAVFGYVLARPRRAR